MATPRPQNPPIWYWRTLPMMARQINWSEETYRDCLRRHGAEWHDGRYSAKTLSVAQLESVRIEMQKAGGKITRPPKGRKGGAAATHDWRAPRIGLARRLWARLVELGEIRTQGPRTLETWAKDNLLMAVDDLAFTSTHELNKVVDGLKGWVARVERRGKPSQRKGG